MSVKKEKDQDGKTRYRVTASAKNKKTGERYQYKRYAKNMAEAKQLERDLFDELRAKAEGKEKITWKEMVERYFDYHEREGQKAKGTLASEEGNLRKHVSDEWDSRLVTDITNEDVRNLIAKKLHEKSPQTKKHLAANIRAVFRLAVNQRYLTQNPAEGVSYKVPHKKRTLPSSAELKKLVKAAHATNFEYRFLIHFLLLSGCRNGEAYALRFENVNFEDGVIVISETWTRKGGFKSTTKNNSSRTIPINSELRDLLAQLEEINYENDRSFVLPRIRSWTQGEAAKHLRHFCKGLGIKEICIHDLRGCFITQMLKCTGDIPKVMRLVDHKRLETTLRYIALAGLDIKDATEPLSFLSDAPLELAHSEKPDHSEAAQDASVS